MLELQVDRTLFTKVISGKQFQYEIVASANLVHEDKCQNSPGQWMD